MSSGARRFRVCIVSSCGGHLTEVQLLRTAYERYDHFYVLNDRIELSECMRGRTFFIRHAERDVRVLINLAEAYRIIWRERPNVILSTGAGPIVPFALVGRAFGIPTIYIETWTRIRRPSLTGRIMYWLAARFYYQWPELARYFPRGRYVGALV